MKRERTGSCGNTGGLLRYKRYIEESKRIMREKIVGVFSYISGEMGTTPEGIAWYVNGTRTHEYPAVGDDPARFPWKVPFYLMVDMQLGGRWVGEVDESALPAAMHVDWIRFYSGSRGGKVFSKFVDPSKAKR